MLEAAYDERAAASRMSESATCATIHAAAQAPVPAAAADRAACEKRR